MRFSAFFFLAILGVACALPEPAQGGSVVARDDKDHDKCWNQYGFEKCPKGDRCCKHGQTCCGDNLCCDKGYTCEKKVTYGPYGHDEYECKKGYGKL